MKRIAIVMLALGCLAGMAWGDGDLAAGFARPPASARPWVYWFPLSGNLTKEGITADLEAMARAGIGGLLYMEVDQGAPKGPADFAGPLWRELFQHACREAKRLGLEINMNNDAGWCGSGGPWITPELSMQKVVWTETTVEGPKAFDAVLARPPAVRNYYQDIAVLAMPAPAGNVRIANLAGKSSLRPQQLPPQPAYFRPLPAESVIPHDKIVDLTAKMGPDGRLDWQVPAGRWLVLRLGHTTTGKDNHPAPESGRGLECDKLSQAAAEAHFNGLMGRLIADNKELSGQGKVLVSTHIDSWEVGSQNWTPRMREEFRTRRGYDLMTYLPTFTGRVVDSLEQSERFLWDLRQTVSDLVVENYAGAFHALANKHGLRLSIEAYGSPTDDMAYAAQADEPMSEFWSWGKFGAAETCTEMASAAHTYGKRILGAEAFTATDAEKWQGHPANIKDLGDWAFCEGVNRFVFHRYAAQPWLNVAPGMSMGPWGLHYERTQTWWEQSKAWHEYLARCQYLLQQGLFVADVCYLQSEGAPRAFAPPPEALAGPHIRGGYNFDGCTSQVVMTRMSVKDGRIVLPDGMSYRVLVLPEVRTMTPALLAKIQDLVAAGATVFAGEQPVKAPGLSDYPACDAQVKATADALWAGGKLHVPKAILDEEVTRVADNEPAPGAYPPAARWIWTPEGHPAASAPPGTRYFRRVVTVDPSARIQSARLVMAADNEFTCWVNGRQVGTGDTWERATVMNVKSILKPGKNVIAVAAVNTTDAPNPAGLVGALTIRYEGGRTQEVVTDKAWQAGDKAQGDWRLPAAGDVPAGKGWSAAMELGPMGMAPWGQAEIPPAWSRTYSPAVLDDVQKWLAHNGVGPDFSATAKLRYIHRRIGPADVYFVANPEPRSVECVAAFRIADKQPELWDPQTGSARPAAAYKPADGRTFVPLRLEPTQSVFVVFREPARPADRLVSVKRDGRELLSIEPPAQAGQAPVNTFTLAAWVKPSATTLLPKQSAAGVTALAGGRNDVIFAPPGHEVWGDSDAGAGFAVGTNGVCVHEHGAEHFPAVLVYPVEIKDWTHVAVVYRDGVPSLYVNGKLAKTGVKSPFTVHGGLGVAHARAVAPFKGQLADVRQFDHALDQAQIAQLAAAAPPQAGDQADQAALDVQRGQIWQQGQYELAYAAGPARTITVKDLPQPAPLAGPWEVTFDSRRGGPEKPVTFEKLEDWKDRPEDGIKYYSGTALYRKALAVEPARLAAGRHVWLDLGDVQVMAQVKVNGKDLGILWKPPYRVDITAALKAGENALEIQVVNLWINRQIGDQQLGEDSDRNANGTLRAWPKWVQEGQPSPAGRYSFTSWRLWKKGAPLSPSGLIGPVQILSSQAMP